MARAQLVSLDLVLSAIAFLIVFLFLFSLWNLYTSRWAENEAMEELELTAFQMSDLLFKSPGIPEHWEDTPSTVITPGLAQEPGVLNSAKVQAFLGLNYTQIKRKWNIERYEFNFKLGDEQGNILNRTGIDFNSSGIIIAVSQFILLDNSTREAILTIGRNDVR